jgi:putative SOS response-associated peptidase YedK
MCGRYTIIAKAEEIEKRFNVEVPPIFTPRYNAAPTQVLPVITNENPQGLSFFQWGLIPSWSQSKKSAPPLINARAETIAEKSSFKDALKSRRCLVISDGYYEWKQSTKKIRIPYRIQVKPHALFAYAGLWEEFVEQDNSILHTFTIITTAANKITSSIHERMPAILTPEGESIWMNNDKSVAEHLSLLLPYPDHAVECFTVSNLVNSVQNDNPQLVLPTAPMDQKGNYTLFD